MLTLDAMLPCMEGNLRRSALDSMERNSWILLNDPTPPMSAESAMMRELRGSARSVKSDKDVKTVAVSSVLAPLLLAATSENTVKARMGDTMGEIYAEYC